MTLNVNSRLKRNYNHKRIYRLMKSVHMPFGYQQFSGVKACFFNPSQAFTARVNASEVSVNTSGTV